MARFKQLAKMTEMTIFATKEDIARIVLIIELIKMAEVTIIAWIEEIL